MAPSTRAAGVAFVLATLCAVGLLGLAAEQYSRVAGETVLESKADGAKQAEVQQLVEIMAKQQKMEATEQKLLTSIQKGEKNVAHALEAKRVIHAKAAAKKVVTPLHKAAAKPTPKHAHMAAKEPSPAVAALSAAKPARTMSLASTDKVAELKKELAAAEAAQATHKAHVAAAKPKAAAAAAAPKKAAAAKKPAAKKTLTTGQDFSQLPDKVGVTEDHKIAKGAGLQGLGWMGSKDSVDSRLRALKCDPKSFVCSGTDAQKKEAMKIVKSIQDSIQHDAQAVNAYGWKEEHALPPAPHM
eukprot:CAMPEP_0173391256 /NCGR_PEP_ID=MMETSP1356-20130122/17975_1 /TAXON_ID=77927 ORGANISM="Hemiselmis virescens, Strain PCC157" /NCGR_SAMPLE_ID=MMETSP1356 /ASSEMBLY_ACC=CAM_ASM_000847 /LENGTH=298 /DNA_ID=CAMNT_0014348841 /DNA_START=16 /DNA_END=912 /DNA_ORIENTATION=-